MYDGLSSVMRELIERNSQLKLVYEMGYFSGLKNASKAVMESLDEEIERCTKLAEEYIERLAPTARS